MEKAIHQLLKEIQSEHGVEILYACESSSRVWSFASPNSDYGHSVYLSALYRQHN